MSISRQAHVVSCALLKHHLCVRQLLHERRWSAAAHTPGSGLGCSSDRSGSVAGAVAVLGSAHTGPGMGHVCGSRAAAHGSHVVMRQASRGIHCGITRGDRAFRAAYNASLAEPQLPLTPQAATQMPLILHGGQPSPSLDADTAGETVSSRHLGPFAGSTTPAGGARRVGQSRSARRRQKRRQTSAPGRFTMLGRHLM